MFAPLGLHLSPNAHQQGEQTLGGKRWTRGGGRRHTSARHRIIPLRGGHSPSPKNTTEPSKINRIFDFGFIHVRGLQVKRDILTILNGIRGREKCGPTYAACCLLACQPPTDLAINLQYKRSLISGSLILKWIIIWLHQSSLLNVKCLQFVKWPLFQPWPDTHVQLLSEEWAP